jgi:hypothetical protein
VIWNLKDYVPSIYPGGIPTTLKVVAVAVIRICLGILLSILKIAESSH